MAGSGKSRANENRRIRQEALREQLANKGLTQQALEIADKLADLKGQEMDSLEAQRLKAAADIKLRLVNKYMPDMKAVEHTGEIQTDNPARMTTEQIFERLAELRGAVAAGRTGGKGAGSDRIQ